MLFLVSHGIRWQDITRNICELHVNVVEEVVGDVHGTNVNIA
jgi:hypothetical protein